MCPYNQAGLRAGIYPYKWVGIWAFKEPSISGPIRPAVWPLGAPPFARAYGSAFGRSGSLAYRLIRPSRLAPRSTNQPLGPAYGSPFRGTAREEPCQYGWLGQGVGCKIRGKFQILPSNPASDTVSLSTLPSSAIWLHVPQVHHVQTKMSCFLQTTLKKGSNSGKCERAIHTIAEPRVGRVHENAKMTLTLQLEGLALK